MLEAVFQSTHPSRGATSVPASWRRRSMFQSTHPSRGATVQIDIPLAPLLVSIHAPLAGCDCSCVRQAF